MDAAKLRLRPDAPYTPLKCFKPILRCLHTTDSGFKNLRGSGDHALDVVPVGTIAMVKRNGRRHLAVVTRHLAVVNGQFYLEVILGSGQVLKYEYSEVDALFQPLIQGGLVVSAKGKRLGTLARNIYQKKGQYLFVT